ncbi:MAG: hypothetical protein GXC94_16865 [Comamonadaceae bacterium]|nr:hypothetical protein [Comamonadaceae bacterium]
MNDAYKTFDHDAYARSKAPDDFWGQIRRTVNGQPVPDEQIAMIVSAIKTQLALSSEDVLLDLASGNGALSTLLFDACAGCLGVDKSDYLVGVAQQSFQRPPAYTFQAQGAAEYVIAEPRPERFTRVLCYGSFAYFSQAEAELVLGTLFRKFGNVQRVFIGNLPDKGRAREFYKENFNPRELSDNHSQIGIWRSRAEFEALARAAGWRVQFLSMPAEFYASYYRYDVLLSR